MQELIDIQKKLYPDLLEVIQERYMLMQHIERLQPIGRRSLSDNTKLTERHVRSEVDVLSRQGLINMSSKGMLLTKEGKLVIDQLAVFMHEMMGLSVLERQLKDILQRDNIVVVPGNSDEQEWVKQEMGKACVTFLKENVSSDRTMAVTGGTTMAAIAEMMSPFDGDTECLFVPARGGIGEKEENQANTIAAKMARQAKGSYRLLYVPDPLSESSYRTMMKEPAVIDILKIIQGSDIVLHGIGDAITMAKRRKTSNDIMRKLREKEAVSEAFGYYFNAAGEVVHKVRTIGIHLDDLSESSQLVITVAGGKSKARAITSYFKQGRSDLLITDEAAAEAILRENPSL
ncbi:central glycolytic genes regulator [Lentibacillus halodurans]|uniref:Central glycolytic genes regulator n=1 Tax=Lentibacillus halodurans TaxID=237679 RepID=A0A1I0WME6_9BACI|nr:sugar-binding domain-containing protein [Lentibacillus halodurans]SFA89547.1 central glycolytic genes regulator [Lentibacillus halodurans]